MKSLKDTNQVIIPTDKTNSFELLDIKTLDIFIQKHINKKAKQIDKERLSTTVDEALKLIEEWKNNGTLNEKEAKYAFESIQSRAVPVPKLLIKDHKDKDENGNYPTRLVVPATNFTAAIPNLGYRGIRQIFDQEKVNYTRKTIIEAAHLKTELESLNITNEHFTIFSLDIEDRSLLPIYEIQSSRKSCQVLCKRFKCRPKQNDQRMFEDDQIRNE